MKIIFRLNYHTEPGESLWLKYSTVLDEKGICFDQAAPMSWLNEGQWEATVKVRGKGRFRMEYNYELHGNLGVERDEWHAPRVAHIDLSAHDAVVLLDTWCSAGMPDYALETDALKASLPPRGPFGELAGPDNANHLFQLRMAAVPPGQVPCVSGSVPGLGNWGWFSAIPMQEIAPNLWQAKVHAPADWHLEYKYGLFDLKLKCAVGMENGFNRVIAPHAVAPRQWTEVKDESYRRVPNGLFRGAGVAIPVFSLRSQQSLGVGEFADLKPMGEWAKTAGLKLIQILPINDTTSAHNWRDSYPYSAISVHALHPLYLRIDDLSYPMPDDFQRELKELRDRFNPQPQVDYEGVMWAKGKLTRQVFDAHRSTIAQDPAFAEFMEANSDWILPYAVFCVKRDQFGTADFSTWEDWSVFGAPKIKALSRPTHREWPEVFYHCWLQFELVRQLSDAVRHLHELGLALKGDLPIGIDRHSVDAWTAPHLFNMESQAGAPPDAFAVRGQNWGFPTYDWEAMKEDDYAWWRSRFGQLSRYFDAFRIDHILGFFRIWQIPTDQVDGIMGHFDPATPIHIDEIRALGIEFDYNRLCRPYIKWPHLVERFGAAAEYVKTNFLHDCEDGYFKLKESVRTQRRIADYFAEHPHDEFVSRGLLDCASEVLFFEVPDSDGKLFHPRCAMQSTNSFKDLEPEERARLQDLYNDYFYRRQEALWEARGYEILPKLRQATSMLLCGEDLGMVPHCVPGVLNELGILSLEIQRMPKALGQEFFDTERIPYMSVVSPSTHDMSSLRGWWKEDPRLTTRFAMYAFGISTPDADLSGELAERIIIQHMHLPAMWAIFPLQDLLAIDESLRHSDPDAERINVPAIMPFYWRYRMHLGIDDLRAAGGFNERLKQLVRDAGR